MAENKLTTEEEKKTTVGILASMFAGFLIGLYAGYILFKAKL